MRMGGSGKGADMDSAFFFGRNPGLQKFKWGFDSESGKWLLAKSVSALGCHSVVGAVVSVSNDGDGRAHGLASSECCGTVLAVEMVGLPSDIAPVLESMVGEEVNVDRPGRYIYEQ